MREGASSTYNIHETKTHFSKLAKRVEAGEEIIVSRAGKPIMKLAPLGKEKPKKRKLGKLAGKIWVASDFDQADKEIEALMNEGEIYPDESAP